MKPLFHTGRGVSEIVGALMLTFIVLAFASLISAHFAQRSRNEIGSYVSMVRQDRLKVLESLTLINVDSGDGVVLWLLNSGRLHVEVKEVDVNGSRFHLTPTVNIPPGLVASIRLNVPWRLNQRCWFVIRTSSGGAFKFEAPT